ncbi:uncharacterized protein LOC119696105 [Motacilla alba alba]|uniref:uncharacterized protein LOC119696105 n=1 Tax=Motacilla alba alba TaxID=1094192 RepID=UPI0018D59C8B|nr:uncharacterized protein LOC119696105 [Motacilla alba alba]
MFLLCSHLPGAVLNRNERGALHLPYKGCHEVETNTQNTAQLDRGSACYLHGGRIQGLLCIAPFHTLLPPGAVSSHGSGMGSSKRLLPQPGWLTEAGEHLSPPFFSSTGRPSPPAAARPGRQAGRRAGRHTRTPPPAPRPQRARGPWLPARLQCPAPLRVPSPAAPPALARSLPASASRSRLCPDLPLLPLRGEACRAASAPQLRMGYGACGEESGAAPGTLSPPAGCLAAPAIPRREGRKEVLNHRPASFPGSAPQVAKARARTQPVCHAAILYLTGWFLPGPFGPKRNPMRSTTSGCVQEHITF